MWRNLTKDFKETETDYHVRAQPLVISRLCPHCGCSNDTIKHAQKTLFIRDMPSHGKIVAIHLDVPRLLCKPCQQTFTAVVPEVDAARQMAGRLVRWIGRQSLEYTYAEVAKQAGVDEKTVRNLFDEYIIELEQQYRRETPVWLEIDEYLPDNNCNDPYGEDEDGFELVFDMLEDATDGLLSAVQGNLLKRRKSWVKVWPHPRAMPSQPMVYSGRSSALAFRCRYTAICSAIYQFIPISSRKYYTYYEIEH